MTVVSVALALTSVPDDVPDPFSSDAIADRWPGEYRWMDPAMLLMLRFVAFIDLQPGGHIRRQAELDLLGRRPGVDVRLPPGIGPRRAECWPVRPRALLPPCKQPVLRRSA